MAKVLLFDLDGTLLPMNTEEFVGAYVKALATNLAPHINPELLVKALWSGTHAMIESKDAEKTNEAIFEEAFISLSGVVKEDLWPYIDEFYEKNFPALASLCSSTPLSKQIVEEATRQGYKVVIATNPVFPKAALEHRLNWAGLTEVPVDLVTLYEESTYTKPHKEYYQMICQKLGVSPEECIMIGNDVQEDLSASQIGMKTFLVDEYMIDRGQPVFQADARGSLEELYQQLKQKEGLFQ
ncbi:HAD family hydrolase [Caldalkalibacillus mannanilyticus]|uniref:HAD family hydrolase n=1 Tax=Caldalkalibacillus mannanilyticus TaxID=1418 RepID=UPI00046A317F|nr:HAD family hydrolase [Caldalkalibacillus mannanilyticus]